MAILSTVKPDLEDLIQQLTGELSTKEAWADLVESGTGQTLIEFMASLGTMQNFNLERQIQELFTTTASIDTSIYTIARMLGVNPRRKVSATTKATLTLAAALPGSITIPPLTQFKVGDNLFYNPSEIIFLTAQTVVTDITLVQGEIFNRNFSSSGTNFQEFSLGSAFTANENLMQVKVNSTPYTRERRSLLTYGSSDTVFLEFTMPDGSIRIIFGNGIFGTIPPPSAAIVVTSATSKGQDVNTATSGLTVSLVDNVTSPYGFVDLTGLTTSGIVGGAPEASASTLRYTAPRLYASAGRAITRNDWKAISIDFPSSDIVDAFPYGEYEVASTDNTLMNVVNVVMLPSTGVALTAPEKTAYLDYIDDFKHFTTQVVVVDAIPSVVNIDLEAFYFDGVDPVALQSLINDQINELFEIKLGSLGRTFHLSDIVDLVKNNTGVDYVILNDPTTPIVLDRNEFASLNTVTLTMTPTDR